MAKIMRNYFGDSLLLPEHRHITDTDANLPSPKFLKERIIVKGKMSVGVDKQMPGTFKKPLAASDIPGDPGSPLEMAPDRNVLVRSTPSKKEKISEELSKVIFLKTLGFKGFKVAMERKQRVWEMCSFSGTLPFPARDCHSLTLRVYRGQGRCFGQETARWVHRVQREVRVAYLPSWCSIRLVQLRSVDTLLCRQSICE